jgi:hypothetical protein
MTEPEITEDPIAEQLSKEVFASMKQAAGAKQLSVSLLKAAKASGCPGFHASGRVYWEKVAPWITEHLDELSQRQEDSKDYWVIFKLRADAKRSQLALEKEEGLYLTKEEVAQQITQLATAAKSVLKTKLEDELPPKLLGADVHTLRDELSKTLDEICGIYQRKFGQWTAQ